VAAAVTISLEEAAQGGSRRIHLPTGREVEVKIPAGLASGQQIRLKGLGVASPGGPPGDALITVTIAPHPDFRVDGADLRIDVPVTLHDAVLGGKVRVPTLDGSGELSIPASVNTTKAMRLKGKGLHGAGDLYVSLRIVLPENGDPDLESLMRFWRDQKPYKVRD
jgi:DnaJ-class molecular chaperone